MSPTLALLGDASTLHLQRWARAFRAAGWDLTVYSWWGLDPIDNIPLVPVLDATRRLNRELSVAEVTSARRGPLATAQELWRLHHLLARADLAHVHYLPAGKWVLALSTLPRVVITPWGSDVLPRFEPFSPARRRWLRYGLRQARLIFPTSRYVASQLTARFGLPEARVQYHPWGVDLAAFDPVLYPAPSDSPFVIGFFKHLIPLYGPHVLLEALAIFRHQFQTPWEARLYGAGPLEEELRARIAALQLTEHVQLMGRVPHAEIPARMAACHVVVSPSIVDEALGIASFEAQALGIPVINSDTGGMPETLVPDESGYLVPPGEPGALAAMLLKLARDPALRQGMGARGRQFMLESGFDWATCVARIDAAQRSLLR